MGQERRRDRTGNADVGRGIEPQVNAVNGNRRTFDNDLATWEHLLAQLADVLFSNKSRDIRVDAP